MDDDNWGAGYAAAIKALNDQCLLVYDRGLRTGRLVGLEEAAQVLENEEVEGPMTRLLYAAMIRDRKATKP